MYSIVDRIDMDEHRELGFELELDLVDELGDALGNCYYLICCCCSCPVNPMNDGCVR